MVHLPPVHPVNTSPSFTFSFSYTFTCLSCFTYSAKFTPNAMLGWKHSFPHLFPIEPPWYRCHGHWNDVVEPCSTFWLLQFTLCCGCPGLLRSCHIMLITWDTVTAQPCMFLLKCSPCASTLSYPWFHHSSSPFDPFTHVCYSPSTPCFIFSVLLSFLTASWEVISTQKASRIKQLVLLRLMGKACQFFQKLYYYQ